MEFDFGEVSYEGVVEGMNFLFPLLEEGVGDWCWHFGISLGLAGFRYWVADYV